MVDEEARVAAPSKNIGTGERGASLARLVIVRIGQQTSVLARLCAPPSLRAQAGAFAAFGLVS